MMYLPPIVFLIIIGVVVATIVRRKAAAPEVNLSTPLSPSLGVGGAEAVGPTQDGITTLTAQKYCSGCGALIHKSAGQCPKCGAPQADVAVKGRHSRIAAALFALLLGGIGIHKFYLGRVGWGILYLLFFWTFIPAILALIEGIIYLTMSDEAFVAKYG